MVVLVSSEPVSGQNSLLTGNLTRKNRNFGLFRTVFKRFYSNLLS